MDKTNCLWGGVKGKIIASALVIAFILCAVALTLQFATYRNVLLNSEEVTAITSTDNGDNTISAKLRLKKAGFHLSKIESYKSGDKLMVKLYASVNNSEAYETDSTGCYIVKFKFDENIKTIVLEEGDGDEHTLITLNHKN